MHEVRCEVIKQKSAFGERFAYESKLSLLEIAQAAVRQTRGS
jgi:hypothetical protein